MLDRIEGIRLEAVATTVPAHRETNKDLADVFGERDMRRFLKSTGISSRRIARELTTLDLCVDAGIHLREKGHTFEDVVAIIFVSQTPEYALPCSSALAQDRLGMPTGVAAFDVNLGCSGYVYGLWLAARLLAGRAGSRVLLLVGDTVSKICGAADRATRPIFGDAGSATIIAQGEEDWSFSLMSDGSGGEAIIVPRDATQVQRDRIEENGWTCDKLNMDGSQVFQFATSRVPEMISKAIDERGWRPEEVEQLLLHQANSLILKTIGRKVGVNPEQVPSCLAEFGNTSGASIPLAMTQGGKTSGKTVMCGFGVGLSWGAMLTDLSGVTYLHREIR